MHFQIKKKIAEKRIQGSLIVVKLKKLNRLDKIRLANRRESLAKEKLNVDSKRLKLQNLSKYNRIDNIPINSNLRLIFMFSLRS